MARLNRLGWKVQAQKRKPQREDFRAGRFDDGILGFSERELDRHARGLYPQTGVIYYKGGAATCDSGTGTPLQYDIP